MVIKRYKPFFSFSYDQVLYEKCLKGSEHNKEARFERYSLRHQNDQKRMLEQFLQGNLFEQGAGYHFLCDRYGKENISVPYLFDGTNDKQIVGHEADITHTDGKQFHLKCQRNRLDKVYSWVFQQKHVEEFANMSDEDLEQHYVLFGVVNLEEKRTGVLVFQKVKNLLEYEMFKLPMNKDLQDNKFCVYYDDFFTKSLSPIVKEPVLQGVSHGSSKED